MCGATLLDGTVADGLGGVLTIAVGVGTGGRVSSGGGDPELAADVSTALGSALTGGSATDDRAATGRGARGESTTDPAVGVVAFGGAAPMPPAPPGAPTGGDAGAGVPSSQPTVSANGRPSATMPRKTGLGESRTPRTPVGAPEKLRG